MTTPNSPRDTSSPSEITDLNSSDIPLTPIDSYPTLEVGPEPTLFYSRTKRVAVITCVADVARDVPLSELYDVVNKEQGVPRWVDVQGLETEEMTQMGNMFHIHPLTIEDCTATDTREKMELIQNYYFIVMNELSYKENTNIMQNHNISIVMFPDLIITFHHQPVYCVYDVVHKMESRHGGQVPSTEWILHALLDSIAEAYETHINQLVVEADTLDEILLEISCVQQSELLVRINSACRKSSSLIQGLVNKEDVLNSLLNHSEGFSAHAIVYLKNVFDQLARMNQKLSSTGKLLSQLNNVYMSKVSVELSVAANQTDYIVKLFAITSVIFLPLNLITGIFGMNVLVPGDNNPAEDYPDNYNYFIALLGIMAALTLFMYTTFYRLHWVHGR